MLIEVVGPPILHDRVRHQSGARVEVPDAIAAQFVRLGRARVVEVAQLAPAPSAKASPTPSAHHTRKR